MLRVTLVSERATGVEAKVLAPACGGLTACKDHGVTDSDAGLRVEVIYRVAAQDTAASLGSGDVPSLATPRALAMLEAATVRIVESLVEPGQTSVGVEVHLQHRVATPVGRDVHACARLIRTEGRRLYFEVELTDTDRVLASGQVVRTLVDRARFIAGLDQS